MEVVSFMNLVYRILRGPGAFSGHLSKWHRYARTIHIANKCHLSVLEIFAPPPINLFAITPNQFGEVRRIGVILEKVSNNLSPSYPRFDRVSNTFLIIDKFDRTPVILRTRGGLKVLDFHKV
jgi:hypothetical protein